VLRNDAEFAGCERAKGSQAKVRDRGGGPVAIRSDKENKVHTMPDSSTWMRR